MKLQIARRARNIRALILGLLGSVLTLPAFGENTVAYIPANGGQPVPVTQSLAPLPSSSLVNSLVNSSSGNVRYQFQAGGIQVPLSQPVFPQNWAPIQAPAGASSFTVTLTNANQSVLFNGATVYVYDTPAGGAAGNPPPALSPKTEDLSDLSAADADLE
jgi:hypothetical protein